MGGVENKACTLMKYHGYNIRLQLLEMISRYNLYTRVRCATTNGSLTKLIVNYPSLLLKPL